jgi:DNA (cytosine-5)-methyltransferase 1
MLTFGSLFAGIGGFDLGLERAGMVCKWQAEIDDYATKVLEKHWPDVPRYRDVCEFPPAEGVEKVDLICGGFPCQDISSCGKKEGINGDRSGLWIEYKRIVRVLRPRFVLIENVSALLIRGLDRVLCDLASLGYDAEWHTFSAAQFGAYHIRERVFILAYTDRDRREAIIAPGSVPRKSVVETKAEWCGHKPKLKRGASSRVWPLPDAKILGVDDGFYRELDPNRLRCLGNAVVPQVAEFIGRQIVKASDSEGD